MSVVNKEEKSPGRSGPTAQQSARISGTTTRGCASAPLRKRRTKKEMLKSPRKKIAGKIRPDCSAVGPNLGDYSPRVRQRAPVKTKKDSLRLSDKSTVRLPSSSTLRLKAVTRRL